MLCAVLVSVQSVTVSALAENGETAFDKTDVVEDLKNSTVNGKPFDLKSYPANKDGELQIINFVEYCYSATKNDIYGLYIYIYNPKQINISERTAQNKVTMCLDFDEKGEAKKYNKYRLKLVSASDLFFKFKIIDKEIDGKSIHEYVTASARKYAVSEIELLTNGQKNATAYRVGGTYTFTGFAQGCGTANNTLKCVVKDLETLELEVHHTFYRTGVSSLGKNHYNEVNTVYFSIPDRVYEQNGFLQKIRAEWWEYKTKKAIVTSNQEFYTIAKDYTGENVGTYSDKVPFYVYYGYEGGRHVEPNGTLTETTEVHNYDWAFNIESSHTATIGYSKTVKVEENASMIPFVFYSEAVSEDKVFDFLYSKPTAGSVAGTKVADYIYKYRNSLGNGYIDCNGRDISKDLFEDSVDEGRTMGYNDKTVDLADTFNLNSYDSNHSWWDKLWDFGLSKPKTDEGMTNVSPIYELQASDLFGTKSDISKTLLINQNDIEDLSAYYYAESAKGNHVILFRFANTDYFTAPAGRTGVSEDKADTYVASQTVFLDFDIIELTFNSDGTYKVIPVVSSPIDIINDFTAPPTTLNLLKLILFILAVVLGLIILAKVISTVVRWVRARNTARNVRKIKKYRR